MKLNLTRPLVFFDFESTGIDTQLDRIVQIGLIKNYPDGTREFYDQLVNPRMAIPPEATAIHGITDDMVKDLPGFNDHALQVKAFIDGCDLAGFNVISYDIPLLFQEFARVNIRWDHRVHHVIDAGNLFKIMEPRTLEAAVKFYMGSTHANAHSAICDANATEGVLEMQLFRYESLPNTVEDLALASNYGRKRADVTGKFTVNEAGEYLLNFGPHRGKVASDHPDYLDWMLSRDFPRDAQAICEEILYPADDVQTCRVCGCTENNCIECIEAQGFACHWVEENLCSRCKVYAAKPKTK